jgi:site-specific recombinase XerD
MPSAGGYTRRATRLTACACRSCGFEKRILALLDDAQMRTLIAYRPKTYRETRLHVAIMLVLDTGLRIAEVLRLQDDDIDIDNLILKVFGKGQKERVVRNYSIAAVFRSSCG